MKNIERELVLNNFKLKKGKRLSDEQILNMPAFKRRKLEKVGSTLKFDTDRKKYETPVETGGLGTGFTDLTISQPLYLVNLSVNITPTT